MFYDIFAELCEKREIKPSKAAEECGINKSNVSSWKNNGYVPRGDALNKIAAYFGVSTDYLLGNEQKNKAHRIDFQQALSRSRIGAAPCLFKLDNSIIILYCQ